MSIFKNSYSPMMKIRSKFQNEKPNRQISCKDLGHGDCEGWLWIKKSSLFKKKFVRRWCVLKLRCLYFYRHTEYEKAEGIIHLQDFQICPYENFKLKDFYIKIYNKSVSFTFAVETQSGFMKWLSKLQLCASNINLTEISVQNANSVANAPADVDWSSAVQASGPGDEKEYLGYSESDDTDVETENNSIDTSEFQKIPIIPKGNVALNAADSNNPEDRTSEELSEATMNTIKRVAEIERLIREKKRLLAQIDNFLKYPLSSDRIQQFWDEYFDQIIPSFQTNN